MVVSSPALFAACRADVACVTGGVTGTVVVAVTVGVVMMFGVVVHADTQASRITSTAKQREYRWNLMMLNSKETFIFVTIPIRSEFSLYCASATTE